jgi:hypothetical protein
MNWLRVEPFWANNKLTAIQNRSILDPEGTLDDKKKETAGAIPFMLFLL